MVRPHPCPTGIFIQALLVLFTSNLVLHLGQAFGLFTLVSHE
ncbi:MAG: hypothetical protein WAV83_07610 [Methanothrix sp.]|nr:hypothetical protein [Euryarchaeota archaeon]HRU74873.1 hypothetical protein [Methanothrix sp.]